MKRQLAHSAGVPFSKRGNQASGPVIVRPSARSTARESAVTLTSCAVTSLSSVSEILMPRLQQQTGVVRSQFLDLSNLDPPKAAAIFKANWIRPELGPQFVTLHMDVRRLLMIRRVRRTSGMDRNE